MRTEAGIYPPPKQESWLGTITSLPIVRRIAGVRQSEAVLQTIAKEKPRLSGDQVKVHVQETTRWFEYGELKKDRVRACVDGRETEPIIGMPGGDAGEFISLLSAVQELGVAIDPSEMKEYVSAYVDRFGLLYMHTDVHALEHIGGVLRTRNILSKDASIITILQFVQNPPEKYKDFLLGVLCHPDFYGCGHLKLMMNNADDYGIDPKLGYAFMRAFYEKMWDGGRVDYHVLDGSHNEGAVVVVKTSESSLTDKTLYPAISPRKNGQQVFVYYPEVAEQFRVSDEIIGFVEDVILLRKLNEAHQDELRSRLSGKTLKQMKNTLRQLASHCTIYEAVYGQNAVSDPSDIRVSAIASVEEFCNS